MVQKSVSAQIDTKTHKIKALTTHIDIVSEDCKKLLGNGATVEARQISPFSITIVIGENDFERVVEFPAPVLASRSRLRIARKSSYVEIIASLPHPSELAQSREFMYPMLLNTGSLSLWNLP
ncbi:hypothetical protein K432DRAFT_428666 [Lepidopterella palustris CBS 459.81]|uniref:Uncharacterized protein n=1 Tax=Lepidopterella palustris CBS 459.81 TaxID=1314670 RepID=A0A8E2E3G2_9PEZI|nr:hypothetical protein K432DRAFT_428666 [Lepidopterella palustris CBS 459.81]